MLKLEISGGSYWIAVRDEDIPALGVVLPRNPGSFLKSFQAAVFPSHHTNTITFPKKWWKTSEVHHPHYLL
jgi:hypothetical protein